MAEVIEWITMLESAHITGRGPHHVVDEMLKPLAEEWESYALSPSEFHRRRQHRGIAGSVQLCAQHHRQACRCPIRACPDGRSRQSCAVSQRRVGWLKLPPFDWPSNPKWLYRLTQGVHVGLGLIMIPVVRAKLWSVIPRLFTWPPARSAAYVIERVSLLMLVGGVLFEIVTGVLNIQYDYIFAFSFYTAHYFGTWVFIARFVAHVAAKLPTVIRSLRSRSFAGMLRTSRADTVPESLDKDGLVAPDPDPPTLSRREIDPALTGDRWRLQLLGGPHPVVLDRAMLAAMPQHTVDLSLACVEGWSTVQT